MAEVVQSRPGFRVVSEVDGDVIRLTAYHDFVVAVVDGRIGLIDGGNFVPLDMYKVRAAFALSVDPPQEKG